ncbi:hypothetical protein ACGFYQ_21840 [Streptomyces sp. NPDC048258]|uniref:hypothetical protein n=1 Tax=Streptomyces sp. NPDC048258 TaxID=3365527 RepID=UPI00372099C5
MQTHDDREDPAREPGLTTEDLARTDAAGDRGSAVYPGEAFPTEDDDAVGGGAVEADAGERGTAADTTPADTTPADTTAEGTTAEDTTAEDTTLEGGTAEGRTAGTDTEEGATEPLLGSAEAEEYRTKWSEIQGRFVDDPQDAVRSADSLVAEVMQNLAGTFATHKQGLEGQWDRGEQVATEDLRLALQHYRSFFNRLLKT